MSTNPLLLFFKNTLLLLFKKKKKTPHVLIVIKKKKKTKKRKCGCLNTSIVIAPQKNQPYTHIFVTYTTSNCYLTNLNLPNSYNVIKLLSISSIKKKILPISILKSLLFILRGKIVIGNYMLEEAT